MILKTGEPVIDPGVPAAAVAQVVIVHERQEKVMVPGEYGPTVAVRPASGRGTIKRSTTLMRLSACDADALVVNQRYRSTVVAMPTYWWPRQDGRIEVFPCPDRDYDAELMGRNGKPVGSARKSVAVVPIESYIAGAAAAQVEQRRLAEAPRRVERFTLTEDGQ